MIKELKYDLLAMVELIEMMENVERCTPQDSGEMKHRAVILKNKLSKLSKYNASRFRWETKK